MRAEIIGVGNQNKYQSFFEASREYLQRELAALGITVGSSRLVPGRTPEVFAQLLETEIFLAVMPVGTPIPSRRQRPSLLAQSMSAATPT